MKNNKGFTLVELLAVIVVLAIIMVIATTQVNNTIKKSRRDAFIQTVQTIEKAAETVCFQDNSITAESLGEAVKAEDVEISVADNVVTVTPIDDGKYDNMADFDANMAQFKRTEYKWTPTETTGTNNTKIYKAPISFTTVCGAPAQ